MSNPKIVLVSTFESELKHDVYEEFNSFDTKSKIVEFFNYDNGIVDNFIDELTNNSAKYPEGSAVLFSFGNYEEFFKRLILSNNLIPVINELFDSVYQDIFDGLGQVEFNEPALIDITHTTKKPDFCTHFVGWITSEDDSALQHLAEHENIGGEYAQDLINLHNDWLRANKDKFDLFFDGSTKEEVLEALRKL